MRPDRRPAFSSGAQRRFARQVSLGGITFKSSGQPEAIAKRDSAEDSKRAVNQAPANRYLANGAANQRQRNDERARDKTRTQDPYVSQRVNERPDEENGNDDVRKRQPVRAVSKPRTDGVTLPETVSDGENPSIKTAANVRRRDSVKAAKHRDLLKLTLEWECGDAAQNKSEHEQSKHPAEPVECGIGLGLHGVQLPNGPWFLARITPRQWRQRTAAQTRKEKPKRTCIAVAQQESER